MIFDVSVTKEMDFNGITEYKEDEPPIDIKEKSVGSEWSDDEGRYYMRLKADDKEDALRAFIFFLNVTNNNHSQAIATTTKAIASCINTLAFISRKKKEDTNDDTNNSISSSS